jgi:two-component system, NarL family, sensor histidine kinase UhpB
MRKPPAPSTHSPIGYELWRDLVAVFGITALSIVLSAHFNLNEAFFAMTRRVERLQLDELPIGGVVLLLGLVWLSWRRYRQAYRELHARRLAEARLAGVLADNRRLAQENLRVQELERKRLARELHDEFGQYLQAIKLDAVAIVAPGGNDAAAAASASAAILRSVEHIHRAMNSMIARLRPVGLDELGLVAAIEHLIEQWHQRLPEVRIDLTVRGDLERLGETLSLTSYRLIQESLTNVYKHAGARHVAIVVEQARSQPGPADEPELRVEVADDGCGMQTTAPGSGFGLSGMRERVESAGGSFLVQSAPGAGFRVVARFPGKRSL